MIVKARLILRQDTDETPFTIAPAKLNLLDTAFRTLHSWSLGLHHPPPSEITRWTSPGNSHQSMQRWIRGHQMFAAITQGLIAVFRELRTSLEERNGALLDQLVDLAVLLLRGSAAALEFTGDFPSDDYNQIIRPSMTPPLVPDTFSGLLSTDHRFLVQMLREMKPSLDLLHEQGGDHHQRIALAIREVYDSHKFVCSRLVGKMPSLLMASGSTKSGAEQIEKFKTIRMKVFEPAAGKSH